MNKIIAIGIAVLVLGSGAFLIFSNSNSDSEVVASESNVEMANSASVPAVEPMSDHGGFVEYNEANLSETAGTKRIVFFHADWCSTCNFFEGQIEEQGVPEGVTILKANFDEDKKAKQLYGVNIQSTFVLLDENGEIVETWPFASGLRGIQDLYDVI